MVQIAHGNGSYIVSSNSTNGMWGAPWAGDNYKREPGA